MARNRPEIERDEKVQAIVDAAEALFQRLGFAGASTAAIAREAGISERTLFWYFPSKDHVLVAVVTRASRRIGERLRRSHWPSGRSEGDLVKVIKALREIRHLLATMHQRAEVSEHVAATREQFRVQHLAGITQSLRAMGLSQVRAQAWAVIVTCFIDGVLLRNMSDAELEKSCRALFATLRQAHAA